VVDLVATYFRRLAESQKISGLPNSYTVGQPSVELIRALITTHLPDPSLARESLDSTLELRIMQYVRAHLADHDLSAASIARQHSISVRHLYATLARSGIVLGDWIRAHRLEECRRDLAKPGAKRLTIGAVGRRWGFADATHFGRVFKEAYGMSPRAWRELRQQDRDGGYAEAG
jgi:AraC-like DNA-binding protein